MSPARLATKPADKTWARGRRKVGEKYLEVAEVVDTEDGEAINVCVGLLVLAGIAAGDAICAAALGERYSGPDHGAAAMLLSRVDARLGARLKALADLKPGAHYGNALLNRRQRAAALKAARELIAEAAARTT